ncbi:hypothetical protein F8388_014009, partial [Cannabis sativa]
LPSNPIPSLPSFLLILFNSPEPLRLNPSLPSLQSSSIVHSEIGSGYASPNFPLQIRLKQHRTAQMGGGMEANKNKFIEEWGSARENLEHNFRWTRRNFALIGLFGIAIPIFVYKGIVKEFHMQDEDNGRPYRKFM